MGHSDGGGCSGLLLCWCVTCCASLTSWLTSSKAAVCALGLFFVLQETHTPTLISRHSAIVHRRKSVLGKVWTYWTQQHDVSVAERLSKALTLPAQLAFRHLPVSLILVFMLVFNGIVNMILSSLGSIYQRQYHFSPTGAGLTYLGIGTGGIVALWSANAIANWFGRRKPGENNATRSEHSISLLLFTGPLFSIGLLWYGWSVERHAFWFVPIPGLFLFGYGYMATRASHSNPSQHISGANIRVIINPDLPGRSCTWVFWISACGSYSRQFNRRILHPFEYIYFIFAYRVRLGKHCHCPC